MVQFTAKKGLFGFKLSSADAEYKKPNKKMTGEIYEVKPTESGISVYKKGVLVADGLEMISHDAEANFFIGHKNGAKICFDPINDREFEVAYCSSWRPQFIISADADFYKIKGDIIFAEPCPEKVIIENGKVDINGGLHLVEGENERISLADFEGEIVLQNFTDDRNAKFYSTSPSYGSVLGTYYTVKDSASSRLIDKKTQKVFFEAESGHQLKHDDVEVGKTFAIIDQDPDSKTAVVHIYDKNGNELNIVNVPGHVQYVTYEASEKLSHIGYYVDEQSSIRNIDFNGNDITKKIQELNKQRDRKYRKQIEEERARREEQERVEDSRRANSRERTNMLMGASLMGLGMPSVGATVIATTAIARHNRKEEEHKDKLKKSQENHNLELGDD